MISKQYSHYLEFLAQKHNILLLSDKNYEAYDEIIKYFNNAIHRNMQEAELENINITLMSNKIEIVMLDTTQDAKQARKYFDALHKYNERIVIISIIDKNINDDVIELMKLTDHILFNTFDKFVLKAKLVETLSVFYTLLSIGRRDMNLKSGVLDVNNLGEFLDTYEGSSLFIVDELIELNQKLKSGELSHELLNKIGEKTLEIADIFLQNELLKEVYPTFKDLGDFLMKLNFSQIEPSGLKAFDYLSDIIDDLNKNLMDMFVDRTFQDIHLFIYSLENNIKFMKQNLFQEENADNGELDFF